MRHKWSLKTSVLQVIFTVWDIPMIDLFATKEYRKCHLFCSQGALNPGSLSDTFHCSWQSTLLYTFSPILIIPQVIFKLKVDGANLILSPDVAETVLVL